MNWFEAFFLGGLLTLIFVTSGGDRRPFRVEACIFGETREVWSDFLEREMAKDPESYCGACGAPEDCPPPEDLKKGRPKSEM